MARQGRELIKEYRERLGLSQKELAEEAGLSQPYIGALERGDRQNPRSSAIEKIAEALELEDDEKRLLKNGFFPALIAEPDEGDRKIQRSADRVWVFSSEPAETRQEQDEYRELLIENIKEGVEYTYWTVDPIAIEWLVKRISSRIEDESKLKNNIRCIISPEEVNWFNFAVYWFEAEGNKPDTSGRISLPEEDDSFKWSVDIDEGTLGRIISRCKEVIRVLEIKSSDDTTSEYKGYEWYSLY